VRPALHFPFERQQVGEYAQVHMANEMQFRLKTEFITLGQLLKAADVVSGGGEAKAMLAEGGILIDGEEDNRRGRKLRGGELVVLPGGDSIRVLAP